MTLNPRKFNFSQKSLEVAIDDLIVARFPSSLELRDNAEIVVELLYESIELFALRIGLKTIRFAEVYTAAVRMTLLSLSKPALRGTCRFNTLPIRAALKWFKSRILNNIKTVLTNPKSSEYLGHLDYEAVETFTFGNQEMEAELARLSQERIVGGLRTLFLEGVDLSELEYLAQRFSIDLCDVIGVYSVPVIVERSPEGNPQLSIDF